MVRVRDLGESQRAGVPLTQIAGERKLRIVTVVPSVARNTGGPAVTLIQGTRAMGDSVNRVIYATDAARPAAARPFRRLVPSDLPDGAADVPIRIFRARPPYQFAFSPGLWYALRQAIPRADLVTIHSANLFPQYAAFAVASSAGVPYIVTPHGSLAPWLARNSATAKKVNNALWQQRMLTNAAAIHFTTSKEAELAGDLTASVPHIVVPNGIDLSRFNQQPSRSFREQHLAGYAGNVVMFLGRIAREKGIDLLIRAFARATSDDESLLLIAGPDNDALTPELVAIAESAGVASRVRFVGPVYGDDQIAALAAADVWVLTSHTESFGNAVIEAMAAGCAVLVSTGVNLAEQIGAADAGVVTSLSIDEIASALRGLLHDAGRRARLRASGRAFSRRFEWSTIAPDLVGAYGRVVANQSGHC